MPNLETEVESSPVAAHHVMTDREKFEQPRKGLLKSPLSRRKHRRQSGILEDDMATPDLTGIMVFEMLKWGSLLVVLLVIFRFVEPAVSSFYSVVLAPEQKEATTQYE